MEFPKCPVCDQEMTGMHKQRSAPAEWFEGGNRGESVIIHEDCVPTLTQALQQAAAPPPPPSPKLMKRVKTKAAA